MTTDISPDALIEEARHPHNFVNLWQTQEDRRGKYWLVRSLGGNSHKAMRMRDWRLSKIERFFGLLETYNPKTKGYDRALEPAPPITSGCG